MTIMRIGGQLHHASRREMVWDYQIGLAWQCHGKTQRAIWPALIWAIELTEVPATLRRTRLAQLLILKGPTIERSSRYIERRGWLARSG
jgi:hypothetical protein